MSVAFPSGLRVRYAPWWFTIGVFTALSVGMVNSPYPEIVAFGFDLAVAVVIMLGLTLIIWVANLLFGFLDRLAMLIARRRY